jgi:hypothetical protein
LRSQAIVIHNVCSHRFSNRSKTQSERREEDCNPFEHGDLVFDKEASGALPWSTSVNEQTTFIVMEGSNAGRRVTSAVG